MTKLQHLLKDLLDQNFGRRIKSADCVLLLDSNSKRYHSIDSFIAPHKVLFFVFFKIYIGLFWSDVTKFLIFCSNTAVRKGDCFLSPFFKNQTYFHLLNNSYHILLMYFTCLLVPVYVQLIKTRTDGISILQNLHIVTLPS